MKNYLRNLLILNGDEVCDFYHSNWDEKLQRRVMELSLPKINLENKRCNLIFRYIAAKMKNSLHEKAKGFVYAHAFNSEECEDAFIKIGITEDVPRRLIALKRESCKQLKIKVKYKEILLILPCARYATAEMIENYILSDLKFNDPESHVSGEYFYDDFGVWRRLFRWWMSAMWSYKIMPRFIRP